MTVEFSNLGLAKRFAVACREDGLKQATVRAGHYLRRRLFEKGPVYAPAMLPGSTSGPLPQMWCHLARNGAFHISSASAPSRKIAVIADLNLPQCRKYRVEQLVDLWAHHDVAVDYAHFEDAPRAIRIMQDATHLMLYRVQSGPQITALLYEARRLRLPVLYDLDDPLFSVSAYETYQNMAALSPDMKANFVAQAPRYLDCINSSDIVSVSTPGMAEHLAQMSCRPIVVRRNFADSQTLSAGARAAEKAPARDGVFRIAFASGSHGHEVDFNLIAAAIWSVLRADQTRRLLLLGHVETRGFPEDLTPQIKCLPFQNYETYLEQLAQADVAVMPLQNDAFNQCKSAVRVIDASAVSVPSLVSTVGDLPALVKEGVTGHVLGPDGNWQATIERLAAQPKRTAKMGMRAREILEQEWRDASVARRLPPALLDWVGV